MKTNVEKWDDQFTKGQWDSLADRSQFGRNALLGSIIRHNGCRSILDVGCGQGLLRRFIPRDGLIYSGLDISKAALDSIQDRAPNEQFICGRVEEWQPIEAYDAVVLNEVLYYLDDFRSALEKFHHSLNPGGLLIVSIWKHNKWFQPNRRALSVCREFFTQRCNPIDDMLLTVEGLTWNILSAQKTLESDSK